MIKLSFQARQNARETGCDPLKDAVDLRAGVLTRDELLAECLNGADEDRVAGWHDYVAEVAEYASTLVAPRTNPPSEAYMLLVAAQDDPSYIGEHAPSLCADEHQDWVEETSYWRFSDGSAIRLTADFAEELTEAEFDAAVARARARDVALEVSFRRPDLPADDVASVLSADPTLSVDDVIASLDEAAAEWAEEREHES
jgi:hypothetical protein